VPVSSAPKTSPRSSGKGWRRFPLVATRSRLRRRARRVRARTLLLSALKSQRASWSEHGGGAGRRRPSNATGLGTLADPSALIAWTNPQIAAFCPCRHTPVRTVKSLWFAGMLSRLERFCPTTENRGVPGSRHLRMRRSRSHVIGSAAAKAQGAAVNTVGRRQAGAVITDVSGNASEVTLTESDGSRVEAYRRIIRLATTNRRPLSRDRRHRPSGSRRAPVPESPIITANCGFPIGRSTLAAPTQEPLQVTRNPAAGRRRQGHPLHASHARGHTFKFFRARGATCRGGFRPPPGSTESVAP
jgi:hypothetical protein